MESPIVELHDPSSFIAAEELGEQHDVVDPNGVPGTREIALGKLKRAKTFGPQIAKHEGIGAMVAPALGSNDLWRNSRQQGERGKPAAQPGSAFTGKDVGVKGGHREFIKTHAASCVCASMHDEALPSLAREFQGRRFFRIIHRFGGGFGFWLCGFGLLFLFWHKMASP
jgi:hypothetical protein